MEPQWEGCQAMLSSRTPLQGYREDTAGYLGRVRAGVSGLHRGQRRQVLTLGHRRKSVDTTEELSTDLRMDSGLWMNGSSSSTQMGGESLASSARLLGLAGGHAGWSSGRLSCGRLDAALYGKA